MLEECVENRSGRHAPTQPAIEGCRLPMTQAASANQNVQKKKTLRVATMLGPTNYSIATVQNTGGF